MDLTSTRGVALRGRVWPGGGHPVLPDGVVVVGADGRLAAIGPRPEIALPRDLRVIDVPWLGPGIVDAHVHLAFGAPEEELRGGVVGVRDLGAPAADVARWRTRDVDGPRRGHPEIRMAGQVLTAVGGYPSRSWGAGGFARCIDSVASARAAVTELLAEGADLIKVALESSGDSLPTPELAHVRAVVDAAHNVGLGVSAHALSERMVIRALDAGVDELAHVPTEQLSPAVVERIAASAIPVVSTLHTHTAGDPDAGAARNAAALHVCGVPLIYGTDLGNAATSTGVDPRELSCLAATGLGMAGALHAATVLSSAAVGMGGRLGDATVRVGARAALVGLVGDPLLDVEVWRRPAVVVLDRQVLVDDPRG